MSIKITNISKTFNTFAALKNVNLEIQPGELVALLGPSGCGKTSLLRIIAGLEIPDEGTVFYEGEDFAEKSVAKKQVGFVFQHYALFKHMTVFDNIAFGLKVRPKSTRPSSAEIKSKVDELLKLVQLDWMADRYPNQLSGGQRQRVALARALAVEPKVLLLDEPFGALDARVRQELRKWLKKLHHDINVTTIFVTHDQEEALEVANRVVIMNEGRIEQIGTPEEVYHKPATPFVYHFLGDVNLFHGRVEGGKIHIGEFKLDVPDSQVADNQSAEVYLRPHWLDITTEPKDGNTLKAKIQFINAAGSNVKIDLITLTGETILAEISQERYKELNLIAHQDVFVSLKEQSVFVGKS